MARLQLGARPSRLADAIRLQDVLFVPQGRLTLSSGNPVMTAVASAITAVLYTPYLGNLVPLWNGAAFVPTVFSELSISTSGLAASKVYDLFAWSNGGVATPIFGPAWTSNVTRGSGAGTTALTRVQGVGVNANTFTSGLAAGYATFLGTIATDSSGATVSWSPGGSAAGGSQAKLNVWNAYNRVTVAPAVFDSTASHTYAGTVGTFRAFDGSNNNSIAFVRGLSEDGISVDFTTRMLAAAASGTAYISLGLDSTTAEASGVGRGIMRVSGAIGDGSYASIYAGDPGIGAHTITALQQGDGTNANTFFGAPYMTLTGSFRQ